MVQDRPILGIVLMLGFCILAPLGDGMAKLLGETTALGLMVLVRFGMQAMILIPLIAVTGKPWRMTPKILRLTMIRTLLHITGLAAMFTALQYLPLADTVAIAFVMPFIMLLLGKYVLNEQVGARRLIACIVGFAGTLLVIQPSFAQVGAPALLPLIVAVVFSLFMLVTRQIAKEIDPVSLQAVSGAMATAILLPLILLGAWFGLPGMSLRTPTGDALWLLLGIGVLGTVAHLLMTWSLRYAPSATLAPMQYLEIPMATLFGWLIFHDLPNGLAALGIGITIAAGLYVILHERANARSGPSETPA
ncbi:Threonine/homoserine efflux transporter RhtA [Ruegeria halocynthiae]|uniref:Threonine/homoserine efflux transporter RhtA n=1 Tax=Ruegeria halocynthiae TaxID=985054 RepID=A0A1H2UL48_9RHOB|nr:DMT family transporter [Ruegeria halocynthiae]SDW56678.1 Threonine/homoserine efflux transporter RhtA [Ruegeria halocynthiae]